MAAPLEDITVISIESWMAAPTDLRRELEGHSFRLLECADRIAKGVANREQSDRGPLERPRARMAIDTSKCRFFTILDPATTVDPGERLRNDSVEMLTGLEMQRRVGREMAGVAEIVLLFDSIRIEPTRRAEHQDNEWHDEPWTHGGHLARDGARAHALAVDAVNR